MVASGAVAIDPDDAAVIDRFFEALAQTPREWALTPTRTIRFAPHLSRACHCPLSYVAGSAVCHVSDAATLLGLDREVASRIANAADAFVLEANAIDGFRARLLKACGLQELP